MQRSAVHRGEPRPRPLPCHDASRSATPTGLRPGHGSPGPESSPAVPLGLGVLHPPDRINFEPAYSDAPVTRLRPSPRRRTGSPSGDAEDAHLRVDAQRGGEHRAVHHEEVVQPVEAQRAGPPPRSRGRCPSRSRPSGARWPPGPALPRRGVQLPVEVRRESITTGSACSEQHLLRAGGELDPRHLLARGAEGLEVHGPEGVVDATAARRPVSAASPCRPRHRGAVRPRRWRSVRLT